MTGQWFCRRGEVNGFIYLLLLIYKYYYYFFLSVCFIFCCENFILWWFCRKNFNLLWKLSHSKYIYLFVWMLSLLIWIFFVDFLFFLCAGNCLYGNVFRRQGFLEIFFPRNFLSLMELEYMGFLLSFGFQFFGVFGFFFFNSVLFLYFHFPLLENLYLELLEWW